MNICPTCNAPVNNKGWCYNSHFNPSMAKQSVGNTIPANYPLTDLRKEVIRDKLQLTKEEPLIFPCKVRETDTGILFIWGNTWQERLDNPSNPSVRWITSHGPREVFECITGSEELYIVEGIFDSLAILREGKSSVAILTTLPRVIDLEKYTNLFNKVIWIPDGDVILLYRLKGEGILKLLWSDTTVESLPYYDDPCSLDRGELSLIVHKSI